MVGNFILVCLKFILVNVVGIDWNKYNPDAKDHCEYEKKEGYSIKSFKDKDGYIFIQGNYS